MNRRSIRRVTLCIVAVLVILGCASPAFVTPPPSPPSSYSVETVIVQTAAVAQTQTALLRPPTETLTITPSPTWTATITPTPTATIVFLFLTEISTPEDLSVDGAGFSNEGGNSNTATPEARKDWDCRVISRSPVRGTVFSPRTSFRAVWTVQNTGIQTWPKKGVDFVYHSGAHLHEGKPYRDIPKTVYPGGQVTLTVSMTAPKSPHEYSTRWSLRVGNRDFCTVRFFIVVK